MTLKRVVLRFPSGQTEALDRLRERYFDETKIRLSRASVARVLMEKALADVDRRKAREVLSQEAVDRAVVRCVAAEGRKMSDEKLKSAMARLERTVKVTPAVETRWLERLRTLGDDLGLTGDADPTREQVEAMVRELLQAEADVERHASGEADRGAP
jgi:hypothetical protein